MCPVNNHEMPVMANLIRALWMNQRAWTRAEMGVELPPALRTTAKPDTHNKSRLYQGERTI